MSRTAHKLTAKKWRSEDIQVEENAEFSKLPLSARVLKGLKRAGFRRPSPIQLKSIPVGRAGVDLMIQSKSGTGKTCVFCTIALEKLSSVNEVQVVVVAPTREIAIQIENVFLSIGCTTPDLGCKSFIGGRSVAEDVEKIQDCKIAIGTPGRLKHLVELSYLKLYSVKLFILDEADKLVSRSFLPEINFLCQLLPKSKQLQIITASATYPKPFIAIMQQFMRKNYVHVSACENELSLKGIRQFCQLLPSQVEAHENFYQKIEVLFNLLKCMRYTQCIVFVNALDDIVTLEQHLKKKGIVSTCLSSLDYQEKRLETMEMLRKYQIKILITTDLAARGIDIEKVDLVINVGIPKDYETYLHRIGRAGRFGSLGISISLVSGKKEEKKFLSFMHEEGMKMYAVPNPLPYDLFSYELSEKDIISFKNSTKEKNPNSAEHDNLKNDGFPVKDLKSSDTEQLLDVISETVLHETKKSMEKYDPLPADAVGPEIASYDFVNSETRMCPQNSPAKGNLAEVKESKNDEFIPCKVDESFEDSKRETPESVPITDSLSDSVHKDHNYSRKTPCDTESQDVAVDFSKHCVNKYIEDSSSLDGKCTIEVNASENVITESNASVSNTELEQQCSSILSDSCFENETVSDFCIENIDLNSFINSNNNATASAEWVGDSPGIDLTLICSFLENNKILICTQDQEMERNSSECSEPSNGAVYSMKQEQETPSGFSKSSSVCNERIENFGEHQVENLHDSSTNKILICNQDQKMEKNSSKCSQPSNGIMNPVKHDLETPSDPSESSSDSNVHTENLHETTSIGDLEIENKKQSSEQKSFVKTNHTTQEQIVNKTKKYNDDGAMTAAEDNCLSNQSKPLPELSTETKPSSGITRTVIYSRDKYEDLNLSDWEQETYNSSESESETSTDSEGENKLSLENEITSCSSPERKSENSDSSAGEDEDMSYENVTTCISKHGAIRSDENSSSEVNDTEEKQKFMISESFKNRKHSFKRERNKNCPTLYQNEYNSKTKQSCNLCLNNHADKHLNANVQCHLSLKAGEEKRKLKCNSPNSHGLKSRLCKTCQHLSETVAENHRHQKFHNQGCCKYQKNLCKNKTKLHPLTSENVRNQTEMYLDINKYSSNCRKRACHRFECSRHQTCYPPIVIQIGGKVTSRCSHCIECSCSEVQSVPSCHKAVIKIHLSPCSHQPQCTSRNHSPKSNHTYQVSQSGRKYRKFSGDTNVKENHHAQELYPLGKNSHKIEPKLQCKEEHPEYCAFLHKHLLAFLGMQ